MIQNIQKILFLLLIFSFKVHSQITIEQLVDNSLYSSNVGVGQIFTVSQEAAITNLTIYSDEDQSKNLFFKLLQGPNSDIIYEHDLVAINSSPNETSISINENIILQPDNQYAFLFCLNQECEIAGSNTIRFKAGCINPTGEFYQNGYAISSTDLDEFDANASFNHCDLTFIINLEETILSNNNGVTLNTKSIFPNPTSGFLKLPENIESIVLISMTGQITKMQAIDNELNISFLESGLYFIRYKYQNSIITNRIVKL
ncbi:MULTISPECIES: T9SS type A sorting domain-containing protein [unclassified Dokdonia]|uniref:T9SS type A sorting domain-containing protein n=1 Tax=unclassified Dokdonia TaxID=2615033 RepID=UPI00054F9759|nr:T9SS type A sorting domain-containing protein [Dokdonia sp. PRO95]